MRMRNKGGVRSFSWRKRVAEFGLGILHFEPVTQLIPPKCCVASSLVPSFSRRHTSFYCARHSRAGVIRVTPFSGVPASAASEDDE